MSKGYEKNYQGIVYKLADCDFEEAAPRLGLNPPVNGVVKVPFLGREYEITSKGITVTDGLPVHPNYLSTLVYYITFKGGAEGDNSSLGSSFIRSISSGFTHVIGDLAWYSSDELAKEFGKDYNKFRNAMEALGAVAEESVKGKEYTWSYRNLPKIPMKLVYYEADDEFPCEIKLKLDDCAKRYMEFEQLGFLCGCFATTLTKKPVSEFVE